ncbi:MAG TPA: hypothetical protein VGX68_18100 [Thermoanaerobaculia bacterium]|jgi:hypothetical protein|nr:hypothetical protein [Thermoanaerobaculia bacterium]
MRLPFCKPALLGLVSIALVSLLTPPPAAGCSICRCGDPTFNALGTDVYKSGAFRVFLDWERFDKEQGIAEEEEAEGPPTLKHEGHEHATRESVVENRFTTALSYSFGERVIAVARIPWSARRLSEEGGEGGAERTRDLADPEIYALVRLWSSKFAPDLGRRAWLSALGGVKTDWGKNDLAEDGERLDEHLQAGTGSTDWFAGLSGLYLLDVRSSLFGSVQRRQTGENDFGYEYGDLTLANLGYERKLARAADAALELNYRDAGRDRVDAAGTLDPNTGGAVLYVTPRLIFDFGRGLVGRAAVQVPVYRDLNGDQREKAVANVGLTYLF